MELFASEVRDRERDREQGWGLVNGWIDAESRAGESVGKWKGGGERWMIVVRDRGGEGEGRGYEGRGCERVRDCGGGSKRAASPSM